MSFVNALATSLRRGRAAAVLGVLVSSAVALPLSTLSTVVVPRLPLHLLRPRRLHPLRLSLHPRSDLIPSMASPSPSLPTSTSPTRATITMPRARTARLVTALPTCWVTCSGPGALAHIPTCWHTDQSRTQPLLRRFQPPRPCPTLLRSRTISIITAAIVTLRLAARLRSSSPLRSDPSRKTSRIITTRRRAASGRRGG
jgi:hypothetical protein